MTDETDTLHDTRFTAEINNMMRVPDRLMVSGDGQTRSPTFVGVNGPSGHNVGTAGRDNRDVAMMKVPDRILVAGGNRHIAAKSTPFELQVENAVLPPTLDHVRVNTPPRSIRLGEHTFPSATSEDRDDDEDDDEEEEEYVDDPVLKAAAARGHKVLSAGAGRSSSIDSDSFYRHGDTTIALGGPEHHSQLRSGASDGGPIAPWEEIQLIRRQIAKLNHRLMAVELENQQQQQREMILSILVSCYFVGKFFMWINRSH